MSFKFSTKAISKETNSQLNWKLYLAGAFELFEGNVEIKTYTTMRGIFLTPRKPWLKLSVWNPLKRFSCPIHVIYFLSKIH